MGKLYNPGEGGDKELRDILRAFRKASRQMRGFKSDAFFWAKGVKFDFYGKVH
jgi:DNA-binding PadR family transcriptional regulator